MAPPTETTAQIRIMTTLASIDQKVTGVQGEVRDLRDDLKQNTEDTSELRTSLSLLDQKIMTDMETRKEKSTRNFKIGMAVATPFVVAVAAALIAALSK